MNDAHGVRRFTDQHGTAWEVWEAHPRLAERRSMRERRAQRREATDRRGAPRPALVGEPSIRRLADYSGWLVFRSAREERRRTPIPDGWEDMSEAQLVALLERSRSTGPYPRLKGARLRELGL